MQCSRKFRSTILVVTTYVRFACCFEEQFSYLNPSPARVVRGPAKHSLDLSYSLNEKMWRNVTLTYQKIQLGTACGKLYRCSVVTVIDAGDSDILGNQP